MKACRIYSCAEGAPRNSTICLPCMKKGYQQDGTLSAGQWDTGHRQPSYGGSILLTAGNSTGSGQGGSITITCGDAPAYPTGKQSQQRAALLLHEVAHQRQFKKSKSEYLEKLQKVKLDSRPRGLWGKGEDGEE